MIATGKFHAVMSESSIRIAPTRLASGYRQSSAVSQPCWVARYATIISAVPTMPTRVNVSSSIAGATLLALWSDRLLGQHLEAARDTLNRESTVKSVQSCSVEGINFVVACRRH